MGNRVEASLSCRELIQADWRRLGVLLGHERSLRVRDHLNPRFLSVVLLRWSQATFHRGWGRVARLLSLFNFIIFGIEVPLGLDIGPGLVLPHPQGVILGAGKIGSNVTIFQQVTLGAKVMAMNYDHDTRPKIESEVTLSAGAKILGDVTVGAGSMVGANAVVVKDVPPSSIAVGVPAKIRSKS